MIGSNISDHAVLDPDRLPLYKFSGEDVEGRTVCDDGIRWDITQGHFAEGSSFFHLVHVRFLNKTRDILSIRYNMDE